MNAWDHPLIKKGMTAQLAKRRARIAAGEKPLGWKVGLGAPAAMQKLGLASAAGRLPDAARAAAVRQRRCRSRATASRWPSRKSACAWRAISAGGATPDAALAAVKEIFPAIELADFDPVPTPDNLDVVLEGDIYQRHVICYAATRGRAAASPASPRA